MADLLDNHLQHKLLPVVPGPPAYSSLDKIAKSRRSTGKQTSTDKQGSPPHRSRSRSPHSYSLAIANPQKMNHTLSESSTMPYKLTMKSSFQHQDHSLTHFYLQTRLDA